MNYQHWGQSELIAEIKRLKMFEDIRDDMIEEIETAIAYESSKDLSGNWTPEYREGFVDGLKRAIEIIK